MQEKKDGRPPNTDEEVLKGLDRILEGETYEEVVGESPPQRKAKKNSYSEND